MGGLPDPLTPPDCDMRSMPFMPLDVVRVMDSDLFALATGDEFKAAFALWAKSWNQIPAGSIPADDRILAHLSGTGHNWSQVREVALRGWVLCSDGRFYHPVVTEKALEAMVRRDNYNENAAGTNDRKSRERAERKIMVAALRADGQNVAWNVLTRVLRDRYSKLSQDKRDSRLSENGSFLDAPTPDTPPVTEKCPTCHELVTANKCKCKCNVTGEKNPTSNYTPPRDEKPKPAPPRNEPAPNPRFVAFLNASGMRSFPSDLGSMLAEWDRDGLDFDSDVLPAVRKCADDHHKNNGKPPYKARFFDNAVRAAAAEEAAAERIRDERRAERIRDDERQREGDLKKARDDLQFLADWSLEPDGTFGKPGPKRIAEMQAKALARFRQYDEPVPEITPRTQSTGAAA